MQSKEVLYTLFEVSFFRNLLFPHSLSYRSRKHRLKAQLQDIKILRDIAFVHHGAFRGRLFNIYVVLRFILSVPIE